MSRRAVVIATGHSRLGERQAQALAESLGEFGVEAAYLGRIDCPRRIAALVSERGADTLELCLGGAGAVLRLRQLLWELSAIGRRDVSIVVHRVT